MFATYTRDAQTQAAQSNRVDTDRVVHMLVGSGAVTDCPGTPPLTPTRTPGSPDDTPVSPPGATATATGIATNTPTGHPFIRLGEVNGLDVPVEASTAAESPFDEFVLQVRTRASYGVEWYGLDGTGAGSLLDTVGPGGVPCDSGWWDELAEEAYLMCFAGASQSATGPGLLGTFTFYGEGSGCVDVVLINPPGNFGSYTVAAPHGESQGNYVDTSTIRHVLMGEGSLDDCPGVPEPTPTATSTFTPAATSTGTITATYTFTPSPTATATSTGTITATPTPNENHPYIQLGEVNGNQVRVEASTAASDPFTGFNLHVLANASDGVWYTEDFGWTAKDSVLDPPGPKGMSCFADSTTFFCRGVAATGPGLLATFVIHAAGDGCVDVVLVNGPGARATHTSRLGISQGNYVDTSTVRHVLIGSGLDR